MMPAAPALKTETLSFEIREGHTHNHFYRRGPVAVHLLVTSGENPRLLVAFPAGNSGVGLWFERTHADADLVISGPLQGIELSSGLRGVRATLSIKAAQLELREAALGSVRALRHVNHHHKAPPWMENTVHLGSRLVLERRTLDGHNIQTILEPGPGARITKSPDERIILSALEPDRPFEVTFTALTDYEPLTPIPSDELLLEGASRDDLDLRALAFLTYEEKLLAGSFRFLTYFGRDTLLSVRMLMPALRPHVIEAALGAVLDRLSPTGEVAHEEAIGEWATMLHRGAGHAELGDEPVLDYKMIDDDFLLAPIVAEYLLDHPNGRERASAFLARRTPRGESYAEALLRNLAFVLDLASPFAEAPTCRNLIALKEGRRVGEWRDSSEGLGLGRIPFNVNAALVPAALEAARRLYASPLMGESKALCTRAERLTEAWRGAHALFHVELSVDEARSRLERYAASQALSAEELVAEIDAPFTFAALALDADGRAIEVMHSDDGFMLLFGEPSPAYLERAAMRIIRLFPLGLRTPVGLVVANPAFSASEEIVSMFTRNHYHGTVIWSWQQAMLAAGLSRQLARGDLPGTTRASLTRAKALLWEVIEAAREESTWELWTWAFQDARFDLVAFDIEQGHKSESNAVQLWSTVYLAVGP